MTRVNKKRNQHYVWKHYLTGWATNGRVWCLQAGRRFCTNAANLANECDFYRLAEMSDTDLAFVERFAIEPLAPDLQQMARGWIAPFNEPFRIRRQLQDRGKSMPEFESMLDVAINNFEEDMHSEIESCAVPLLAELRGERAAFLDDDEKVMQFTRFIAAQYMRTPSIMMKAIDAAAGTASGINATAVWGLLRTIFATNIAFALYRRRETVCTTFLAAGPNTTFITGDQPMVNVRGGGAPDESAPTELELFYPLSPSLGLVLDFDAAKRTTVRRELSDAETAKLNGTIIERSIKQIYAVSEQALFAPGDGRP